MNIKNIGIMAHVDAGKTTVTEQILYTTGIISKAGRVDKGDTITDSLSVEKQRGITVKSGSVSIKYKDCKINIIDTPGHMDFYAEVERVFGVLEGAVLVISAKEGIQSQTRSIFRNLHKMKIPTIIFINKIDREGVDLPALYKSIKENLTEDILIMQDIQGLEIKNKQVSSDDIIEKLIEKDDYMAEKFFNEIEINESDSLRSLKKCVEKSEIYPVFHGYALKGGGIKELLTGIELLPNFSVDNSEDFQGYVFKVERDENSCRQSYIKILSGSLKQRQIISYKEMDYKIKGLKKLEGIKKVDTEIVSAGDIAVIPFAKEFLIGDMLGTCAEDTGYKKSESVLQVSVSINKDQRINLIEALTELTEENPELAFQMQDKGEMSISIMGSTQLEVIESILRERYGLFAVFGEMETVYKERPSKVSEFTIYCFKLPNPYYGTIGLRVEPLPLGSGIVYESEISFGYLNTSYQAAVKEGVMKGIQKGLYGWEVTDCKITFFEAFYSSAVSTPADFRLLAPYVLEMALMKAEMEILEPVYSYALEVPVDVVGKAVYDIQLMRGTAENIIDKGSIAEIQGTVPVSTAKNYGIEVSSYTKGEGLFSPEFTGFQLYEQKVYSKFADDKSTDKIRNMFLKAFKEQGI